MEWNAIVSGILFHPPGTIKMINGNPYLLFRAPTQELFLTPPASAPSNRYGFNNHPKTIKPAYVSISNRNFLNNICGKYEIE
jgi:hypothetical protein